MKLKQLDHYFIRTNDVEKSKLFYANVLGLTVGYRPSFKTSGYWLYIDDKPVVHLMQGKESQTKLPNGDYTGLGHIAFIADNFQATIEHLKSLQIPFEHFTVPEENGAEQIFINDPDGVRIELNFASAI